VSNIPTRRRGWRADISTWMMMLDRLEHYCRLKSISLDRAALIAVGILPETWEGAFVVFWIDGDPFLSSTNDGREGDDADAIWGWVVDCKERWISVGKEAERINLVEFIDWVSREYQKPHWLEYLENSGHWGAWTSSDELSTSFKDMSPDARREHVSKVLVKHGGNQTHAGKELGISRTRIGQLIGNTKKESRKPLAFSPQDPFGIATKPASKKRS